jgi:uncharacterized membrane protein
MTQKLPASNVVAVLAYIGGALTGLVVLALEKKDQFVRFHAMQSTITFLLVLVANLLLRNVPVVSGLAYLPLGLAVTALWIVLMVKAFMGERYKLPYIGDFAERQLK